MKECINLTKNPITQLIRGDFYKNCLTHYSPLIQLSLTQSKWNMGEIYHFWPKNDGEKWSRKILFLNSSMRKANFGPIDLLQRTEDFLQNYKFSNKNDLDCAWRDFKRNLCRVCRYV